MLVSYYVHLSRPYEEIEGGGPIMNRLASTETSAPASNPYEAAWRALVAAEGTGPSRSRAVVSLDPGCGDEACFYFDAARRHCLLLEAPIRWTLGTCRTRAESAG